MPTPNSSATPYATPADMQARKDVRTLCMLCSDTNAPVAPADLPTHPRLLACLADASGMVEAAAGVSGCYQPADLQALAGTVSGSLLARLVCDLAMGLLFAGRPDRSGKPPEDYAAALETLEQVRRGERVFGLAEQQQAGLLSDVVETPRDVERRGGLTVRARRLFGTRVNQLGRLNGEGME